MTVLHSINALRVIAEYLVVRMHIFEIHSMSMDMFVRDLMSFFFVLSGFVVMYTHYDSCFESRQQKLNFWVGRWRKTYPSFLLNLSFYIPSFIITVIDLDHRCVYNMYCPIMQMLFLSCWAGCGVYQTFNEPSWYLITLAWLWLLFPFIHSRLKSVFSSMHWAKMLVVSLVSTAAIFLFIEYNIFTICTLPIMRAGEFVIGCGVACLMQKQEFPSYMWFLVALMSLYLLALYVLLSVPHGMNWLCLNEDVNDKECRIWHKADKFESTTPCWVVMDKFFNKHAMLWAVLIYTVASAERAEETGVVMRVLGHDIFKFVSSYSLSVYLGHVSMQRMLTTTTRSIGWGLWHDDTLIISVYFFCYILHLLTERISVLVFKCSYSLISA